VGKGKAHGESLNVRKAALARQGVHRGRSRLRKVIVFTASGVIYRTSSNEKKEEEGKAHGESMNVRKAALPAEEELDVDNYDL